MQSFVTNFIFFDSFSETIQKFLQTENTLAGSPKNITEIMKIGYNVKSKLLIRHRCFSSNKAQVSQ